MTVAGFTVLCMVTSLISTTFAINDRLDPDRFLGIDTLEIQFANCFLLARDSRSNTKNAEFRCGNVHKGDELSINKVGDGYSIWFHNCPLFNNLGNAEFRCGELHGEVFEVKAEVGGKWSIKQNGCALTAQQTTLEGKTRNARFECEPMNAPFWVTADIGQLNVPGLGLKGVRGVSTGDGNYIFMFKDDPYYKMVLTDSKGVAIQDGYVRNPKTWTNPSTWTIHRGVHKGFYYLSNVKVHKSANVKESRIKETQCSLAWAEWPSHESREMIGRQEGFACTNACFRKRQRGDRTINGVYMAVDHVKECWCLRRMGNFKTPSYNSNHYSKSMACLFTARADSFRISGDGCKLTKMKIMGDKLAAKEGEELLGIVTGASCTGFKDSEKSLSFSRQKSISNSVSMGQSKSHEVNWGVSAGMSVETSAGFLGTGVATTYSVEVSVGGAVSWESSKEVGTETSSGTDQGASMNYRTPGIAMIIGWATSYKIDNVNVPARQTIVCGGGYTFNYDTTLTLKAQTYGHVHYDQYEGRFFKGQCTSARKRCVGGKGMNMRSFKTLYDAENAFSQCLKDENGTPIGAMGDRKRRDETLKPVEKLEAISNDATMEKAAFKDEKIEKDYEKVAIEDELITADLLE